MLITQSTDSSFVPRPSGRPRRSVVYGPRAFEGPLDRSLRQLSPGVKMGSSTRSARTRR